MKPSKTDRKSFATSIEPWLTVGDGAAAVLFYTAAFSATEIYHMEDPGGGLVVKLNIDGACCWISGGPAGTPETASAEPPVRMIITVTDPDALFEQALKAGATSIFPVGEAYGWRLGRLSDPFGHHWEIGHPLG